MSFIACMKSRWKDLTPTHQKIRRSIENDIIEYTKNKRENILPIVIEAPYGSGKSELLKYLCCFGWRNGIPAIYIPNFKDLVNYIEDKIAKKGIKKIHESELPEYIVSYFDRLIDKIDYTYLENTCEIPRTSLEYAVNSYKNRSVYGLLLVDEIEESYEEFKKIIDYESTPFRGLYEEIRNGKLPVFIIFAFGPSSIAKEATTLTGGWRTQIKSIPLIDKNTIYEMIREIIENRASTQLRWAYDYIANTIWFMSKGRYGWAYNLVISGIPENILSNIEKGVLQIHYLFGEELKSTVSKEIVKDIPLMDIKKYNMYLTRLRQPLANLFKILVSLVGPIPEKTLEKIIKDPTFKDTVLDKNIFVKGSKFIDINHILNEIRNILERRNTERDIINIIIDTLRNALEAYSHNGQLLLGDNEEDANSILEAIRSFTSSLLLELYRADASSIIDSIDMKSLYRRIRNRINNDIETHYAIHPKALLEIYPPVLLKPLLGCSKYSLYRLTIDTRQYPDINRILLEMLTEKTKLRNNIVVYNVFDTETVDFIYDAILEDIQRGKITVILPVSSSSRDRSDLIDYIRSKYNTFIKLGLVNLTEDIGDRLSMFIYGLTYCILNCRNELDRDLKENELAKYLFEQYKKIYNNVIDRIVIIAGTIFYKRKTDLYNSLRKLSEIVDKLISDKGKYIGSEQARLIWAYPFIPDDVKTPIKNIIGKIPDINPLIKEYKERLKRFGIDEYVPQLEKIVFKDLKLLASKSGKQHYLEYISKSERLKNAFDKLLVENKENDLINSYMNLLKDIILKKIKEKDICEILIKKNISEIVKKLWDYVPEELRIHHNIDNPISYIIVLSLLDNILQNNEISCNIPRFQQGISQAGEIRQSIKDLISSIKVLEELLDKLPKEDKQAQERAQKLKDEFNRSNNLLNKIEKYIQEIADLKKNIMSLDKMEKMNALQFKIVTEIINKFYNKFIENLTSLIQTNSELKEKIDSIVKNIEEIMEDISDISIYEKDIEKYFGSDILSILYYTTNLEESNNLLTAYSRKIQKLKEMINDLKDRGIEASSEVINALLFEINNIINTMRCN